MSLLSRLTRIGLIALAALVLVPAAANAQDGPQFGNWGPGKSPPDQEGPGTPPSGGSERYGAPSDTAAAPYSAMPGAGGAAVAPIPWSGGCSYDLRGTWWNDGRWTAPSYATYSQYVVVRQYRNWIQAVQDDGTGYYGQCIGTSLNFDVYQGLSFVGRQTGSLNSPPIYYPYPGALYDTAPSAAAPVGFAPSGITLRASFTWASLFGSGTETWQRTSTAYRPIPIPYALDVPGPVATPVPAPTPAPTPAPIPQPVGMHLDVLSPSSGPSGTDVVVVGIGFSRDDNIVTFGPSAGLRHPDGSPGNLVVRSGSPDGRTLRFSVPTTGPSGILCDNSGGCVGVTAAQLQPGRYDVTVISNSSGASNSVSFELLPSDEASAE